MGSEQWWHGGHDGGAMIEVEGRRGENWEKTKNGKIYFIV